LFVRAITIGVHVTPATATGIGVAQIHPLSNRVGAVLVWLRGIEMEMRIVAGEPGGASAFAEWLNVAFGCRGSSIMASFRAS
jgi:hypothetical protein